jgi:hypothetical protein
VFIEEFLKLYLYVYKEKELILIFVCCKILYLDIEL